MLFASHYFIKSQPVFFQHTFGNTTENRNNGNYVCLPVHIGKNVFIGENVRILKGVHIGDGAVIGNSSLVTKNVPAHTVYAGNPAKFIKKLLTSEKE